MNRTEGAAAAAPAAAAVGAAVTTTITTACAGAARHANRNDEQRSTEETDSPSPILKEAHHPQTSTFYIVRVLPSVTVHGPIHRLDNNHLT